MSGTVRNQRTLKQTVVLEGIGLHQGLPAKATIHPAPVNTGIVFVREDLGGKTVRAHVENVSSSKSVLSTVLAENNAEIQTVEHLLSAATGLYLDNMIVSLSGPEMPILDGSALNFIQAFRKAGIVEQTSPARLLAITRPVSFVHGNKEIHAEPSSQFEVHYEIDFFGKLVQDFSFRLTKHRFQQEIAPSKTFCFASDVEKMQAAGMAKGGSFQNALVYGDQGLLNPEAQTFENEFVRHKILDFLGDMRLAGAPIIGKFTVKRGGHAFHTKFLSHLLSENLLEEIDHVPVYQDSSMELALHWA
ncbi:UDP-3-O-acyl-N-acetylglucosamine deacetylase [Leptospirillum ferrooxidans]|uniref:UDP-3-O-acyl-N-acetylglucosamine deacetylase n=1 Tax=Leptospirillum ferrooxidans (strain C2-3) TaxID=1162668 RepID=I0IRZ7_LEPFC|nr:UDP-3-O-acyl-N-acetylglucosamine deacetylase [Leptospirillum ferrooxidans]BAM08046.1 putative UDP-3-o-acyl-N-acetylglucosamine deacetylase [Leptospirillum ferrooxidans C2-3]